MKSRCTTNEYTTDLNAKLHHGYDFSEDDNDQFDNDNDHNVPKDDQFLLNPLYVDEEAASKTMQDSYSAEDGTPPGTNLASNFSNY
jgi:hypothetical protein